jgi:hypothetical protein
VLLAGITFLTPLGAAVVAAALLPAGAFVLAAVRVRRVLAALRLEPPRGGLDLPSLAALIVIVVLLGVAVAQPALARSVRHQERTNVQVLFVVDVSGSMAASASATGPTRLTRAIREAERLRAEIPQVPSGVATLTDRVVPDLLPVGDVASFNATLERAVGIEQPPPAVGAVIATSFGALTNAAAGNFFNARRRVVVLLSDGETVPYDSLAVGSAFARTPKTSLLAVHVWARDESIHLAGGRIDPGYQPDPASAVDMNALASATNGVAFDESRLGAAGQALRRLVGTGPTRPTTVLQREARPLSPYVALVALLPAAVLMRRRARRFRTSTTRPGLLPRDTTAR